MATKLSMSDPNPGIWFKFDDNDPESGDIGIRPLNQAKRDEIRKKAIKKRIEYKHGQRFEVEELDDDKFSELLWDYSITGWNNLEDDDGKPIECNSESKLFLMRNHVGFARFIGEKMEKLAEDYEKQLTAERENLSKGSSASGTRKNQTATAAKS